MTAEIISFPDDRVTLQEALETAKYEAEQEDYTGVVCLLVKQDGQDYCRTTIRGGSMRLTDVIALLEIAKDDYMRMLKGR